MAMAVHQTIGMTIPIVSGYSFPEDRKKSQSIFITQENCKKRQVALKYAWVNIRIIPLQPIS